MENDMTNDNQPKKRGRPRIHPPKVKLTAAQRSALSKATWKDRKPKYERTRVISLRPDAFNALNALRGDRSWSDYLCELAGIAAPPDRRYNATPKT